MDRQRLVVPILFPDPELYPLNDSFVRELDGFAVTLFGYWETGTDESPDRAREEHEVEAEAVLYELAAQFSHEGIPAEISLYFGPGGEEERTLQQRIAERTHASGVLVPNDPTLLRRVLVAVRDQQDAERMTELVSALNPETTLLIELYHAAESDQAAAEAETLLADMREVLHDRGFPDVELTTAVEVTDDVETAMLRRSRDHELIVMGESEQPDVADHVFGPRYEFIAEKTELPILLARAIE